MPFKEGRVLQDGEQGMAFSTKFRRVAWPSSRLITGSAQQALRAFLYHLLKPAFSFVFDCCSGGRRRRRISQNFASQHSRSLVPIMVIMFKSS